MKQIVSLIALCLAPHLWAQTPFEDIIQKSKNTLDALKLAEDNQRYYKLELLRYLFDKEKITSEQYDQMAKEIREANEQHNLLHYYKQALQLNSELQQKNSQITIDTIPKTTTLDSLITDELKMAYKEERRELYKNRMRYGDNDQTLQPRPYMAMGLQTAIGDDNHLKPHLYTDLGLGFIARINKKQRLFISAGLVWQNNRFEIKGNNYFVTENEITRLMPYEKPLKSSKLRLHYLIIPIELQKKIRRESHIGIGCYFGGLIDATQKIKYEENGEDYKLVFRNNLKPNRATYGVSAQIGYGGLAIYAKYSLAPLFQHTPTEIHPLSIGVSFYLN